jgi:hypothetical protein
MSASNAFDVPDTTLPNRGILSQLNSNLGEVSGGQSDHSNPVTNAVSEAPIVIGGSPNVFVGHNDSPATNLLWDGHGASTGTPQIMATGGGSLSASGGSTPTSGGSSATSGGSQGSGLIINVTYDASVANAPAAFKTDVAAAVQYFESEFTNPDTININVGYGEVDGQSLGSGALGELVLRGFLQLFAD